MSSSSAMLGRSVLVEVELRPNQSKPIRSASLRRYTRNGKPLVGVLELKEQITKTGKEYVRRYCVVELPPCGPDRVFRIIKPAPDHFEPYYVCLKAEAAVPDECTCIGFENLGHCCHVEAVRVVVS